MAVDGTFTKGQFILTLLLAVGIDANGQTTLLAWAIVESESKASWSYYFFFHLCIATRALLNEQYMMISDHDKGLEALTEEDVGPNTDIA